MQKLKDSKTLYEFIIQLSTYDINKMIEEAKTQDEKIFYLKLEELKTRILQKDMIKKGVY